MENKIRYTIPQTYELPSGDHTEYITFYGNIDISTKNGRLDYHKSHKVAETIHFSGVDAGLQLIKDKGW